MKELVQSKLPFLDYKNIEKEPQAFWIAQSLLENITTSYLMQSDFKDVRSKNKVMDRKTSHGDLSYAMRRFRNTKGASKRDPRKSNDYKYLRDLRK